MNKEKNKALIIGIVRILFVLLFEVLFVFIWSRNLNNLKVNPFMNKGNWLIAGVYLIELILLLQVYGGLKIGHLARWNVILSQSLALMLCNVIMSVQIILIVGDMHLIAEILKSMLLLLIIDIVLAILMTHIFDALLQRLYPAKKILLVYEEYSPNAMIEKFEKRRDKYIIQETLYAGIPEEELKRKLSDYTYVMLYDISSEKRNEILKYCYMHNIEVYMTSKISDTIIRSAGNVLLFDSPLLHMINNDMTFGQTFMKRLLDLLIAVPMFILASPIMLVVAIAIKAYDGGPVLYKQERATLHGRKFMIYKFRSMIVNAEGDGKARLASQNDSRITPVGEFIRKTRLDELPQLINILKGEMSIVGPRPERPEIIEKYEASIPEFACRLKVKGGLTGYAQIYGKYNTTPYDKLKMDMMYIQNYSFWLDIQLILMTLKIMFIKESTEGVVEGKRVLQTSFNDSDKIL